MRDETRSAALYFLLNHEGEEQREDRKPSYWDIVMGPGMHCEEKRSRRRCNMCDRTFGQFSNLNKHIKVVHQKLRPWPCRQSECSKMFAQRSVARKHFDSVHAGKKPFQCLVCGKNFSDNSNMKKHERLVHRKERTHGCFMCEKRFGERRSLTDHVDSVHKKLKPHACEHAGCNAKFGQKSHLSTHTKKKH